MKLSAFGLAALALLTGCASVPAGRERTRLVQAEGWAPADAKRGEARRLALADAQRRAVAEAAGVRVTAMARVEAAVAVRDTIRADVEGSIVSYRVLDERVEEGFHKTRISAVVSLRQVGEPPLGLPPGNPSVAVESSAAVGRAFSERGFAVAPEKEADFLVKTAVRAWPMADARLGAMRSYRVRVSASVVERATGEVVLEQVRESAALGADASQAQARAADQAADLAGQAAAQTLAALLWKRL